MLIYSLEGRCARFISGLRNRLCTVERLRVFEGAWPFGVVEVVWCAIALRLFARANSALADQG
jgi:hypothetical protein